MLTIILMLIALRPSRMLAAIVREEPHRVLLIDTGAEIDTDLLTGGRGPLVACVGVVEILGGGFGDDTIAGGIGV